MTEDLRIVPAGDAALLVELPARIDPEISGRAIALERAVRTRCAASVRDVVVGYCSVTVYFDPLRVDATWLESEIRGLAASLHAPEVPDATRARGVRVHAEGQAAGESARSGGFRIHEEGQAAGESTRTRGFRLQAEGQAAGESTRTRGFRLQAEGQAGRQSGDRSIIPEDDGSVLDVPVCYDREYGPDLPDVAAFAGGTVDDVIALHSGVTYRVYVVGFVPGFPYMASVDPRIAVPRRTTPRTRVPAGSVAIAAGQTGIYPSETPGGWHLIGRTRVKPYDASRPEPFLFKPGDRVRFHPIDRDEFERGG